VNAPANTPEAVVSAVDAAAAPPLAGERLAFTGTLASMTHRQAHELAEQLGGTAAHHVSRQTTMLIVGEEGWPLEPDGTPALKLLQASRLRDEGLPIRILNESDWLTILGLEDRRRDVARIYTPAMLSQLLGVGVGEIRRWQRAGLIRPVRQVYRLSYFDYREAAAAQKLAELLKAGVPKARIAQSMERLAGILGRQKLSLVNFELLQDDHKVAFRDDAGLIDPGSGQRLLDFEETAPEPAGAEPEGALSVAGSLQTHWGAEEWLAEAVRHAEAGELAAAVEAFRLGLLEAPTRADAHFQLAEVLYRQENLPGALERYHVVVELDRHHLEAWIQLGCVHQQLGQLDAACDAFRIALDLHPEYPDAHWHLAEALHRRGRTGEAVPHWKEFLRHARFGPWGDLARQRLAAVEPADAAGT